MSQDTFPFEAAEPVAYDDSEGDANRKKLVVAGGVVAALVLGAGAYLFLGGSGDTEEAAFVPVKRAPRSVAAAPGAVTPAKKLPAAYKEQLGRDPFRALYVVPAAAPAAPTNAVPGVSTPVGIGTGSIGTGSTGTGSTGPGNTGTGSTATGGTSGTGSTPTAPVVTEYKLLLKRVYGADKDRTAVFTIDGKQQVAKIGSKFGPTSEILLLSLQEGPKPGQWTAVLQVGDGDPFDVALGTPAYVR